MVWEPWSPLSLVINDHPFIAYFISIFQPDDLEKQWTPEDQVEYQHVPGPIPTFQNQYGCIQEVVFYSLNTTFTRNDSYILTGNLTDSACSGGYYYFTPVIGTNLHFLVIKNYQDLSSPSNFNCRIENR